MTHTTHTHTHKSICDLQAVWNVTLQSENENGQELWIEATGNTFGEALQSLYFDNTDDIMDAADRYISVFLSGDYQQGDEEYAFEFLVDLDAFSGIAHYTFAKGRITVEDLMAVCCAKEVRQYPGYLPLSAFTAGSKMAA